ncbi:hypothetical protein BH23CHL9_BH23CHL9_10990 [soil metagenome]
MRNRWIQRTLLVMAITLGACAPQQGTDASDEPSQASASVVPVSQSSEAAESPEATPTNDPTPPDYDY